MNVDKMKKEIQKKQKEMEALQKKIAEQELKESKFTSSYILPPALEAIAGHICMMNEKDYYVALTTHYNEECVHLVVRDAWSGTFNFSNNYGGPYSSTSGIVYEGDFTEKGMDETDYFIPVYVLGRKDIPEFFVALFEYSKEGYTIRNLPVNRKTGEVIEEFIAEEC